MDHIGKKNFNSPDETATPCEKFKVEIIKFGDKPFQKITAEPGWRWTKHLKPVVGTDICQMHHIIYMISGTLATKMQNGKEVTLTAGDIGNIPPGHDGWTVGDEPAIWLDITR